MTTRDGAENVRVTLQTIADLVGVSRATVSNAYNRPERLSVQMRERILRIAAEHGYAGPDPKARSLRTGRSGTVGVLFTEPLDYAFSDPAAVSFLGGFSAGVGPATSGLVLIAAPPRATVADVVRRAPVDGMCVYSMPDRHEGVATVLGLDMPVVLVDQPWSTERLFVGIDDYHGGELIGEHLTAFGHRRVGVLTSRLLGDDHQGWVDADRVERATFRLFRQRLEGLRHALGRAGVDWNDVAIQERRNSQQDGAIGAAALLQRRPVPTAIVALTDQLALGALEACRSAGHDVPRDISVTGFDDIAAAAAARPALTTIAQPIHRKGEVAGQVLAEALESGSAARVEILPVKLVDRDSVTRPRSGAS